MTTLFAKALLASALLLSGSFSYADESVRTVRKVEARTSKVQLGGVLSLTLRQGDTPSLVLSGDKEELAKVTVTQSGDTLIIDTSERHWSFKGKDRHTLRAELTLPKLTELTSRGVGSSDVQGFSGETITLNLDGAGSLNARLQYKHVVARLGGVGGMTLDGGQSERVDLDMNGAGGVTLRGRTRLLKANLGGVGGLEAKDLIADAVELSMTGLGSAGVHANSAANLVLSGLGSATVYGKPATRNASAHGLGSVSWQ